MAVHSSTAPFDWDDARYFLAAYRCGSLSGAAQELAVSHSTVRRRIAGLEDALGTPLFNATPEGLVPTEAADAAVSAAEALEVAALAFSQRLEGNARTLRGSLQVTTFDGLADFIAPSIRRFTTRHPNVTVVLTTGDREQDLANREADIAIRLTNAPDPSLFGRKIASIAFAPFAAPMLLERHGKDTASLPWVMWTENLRARGTEDWYAERSGGRAPVARVSEVVSMLSLVRAGVGAAVLPIPLASPTELHPLGPPLDAFRTDVWSLCHTHRRKSERIRAFMEETVATGARLSHHNTLA